ncbi:hypothetical protein NQ315_015674 [Exocentrus adspersus]|uniref:CHK kinase-like domain-containing protein n=1 Tax=Exocentrus adspersus TaxID=1586481 RepID=A0AAV8W2L8_9CUCU|nr:hypothetical protein NQ315_015674 [Exocentrus adspersus]
MNSVKKVCLELCEEILSASSVTDKVIVNYSVKLPQSNDNVAEVVLVTKEDEYKFLFDLPEEDVYNEKSNNYNLSVCIKCSLESKYKLRRVSIKGFDVVEFGKVQLDHLKIILEQLSEEHAKCIEENNLEKKSYKSRLFSVSNRPENFIDVLRNILNERNEKDIDPNIFLNKLQTIQDTIFESAQTPDVCTYGKVLSKKIFIKNSHNKGLADYKILNIRTERSFPLVYDLLLTIFAFSDQNMRQHNYHDLLNHYYKSLQENLQSLSLGVAKFLPLPVFQKQAHTFLLHAKIDTLKQLCEETSTIDIIRYKDMIWAMIKEINECVLYPKLSREDCYKIVQSKIGSSEYKFLNYKLIAVDERKGFLGDYYKLSIEIQQNGSNKLLQFFAKYLPTYNDMALDLALCSFKKEEFYYKKLIPELNDLGLGDVTNFLPKWFFSRTNDVLVFEDMSVLQYESLPVNIPYTYELLSMTIKRLAQIHACSIIYEERLSGEANETVRLDVKYPEYVEEMTCQNVKDTTVRRTFACAIRTFINGMLPQFPDIPKKITMEQFQNKAQLVFNLMYEKAKKSDRFRNVLCQGDCWSSNILFKADKSHCYIVDYQVTRYCPPGHDINFLLYMTCRKRTRTKFESKLLQEYYTELSNILQKYKVDPQKIYTYQEFLDCYRYMKSQGLCHSIILLQFVLFPAEKLKYILEDREQSDILLYTNRDIFVEELKVEGGVWTKDEGAGGGFV